MDDQLPIMEPLCVCRHRSESRKEENETTYSVSSRVRRFLTRALITFIFRGGCFLSNRVITYENWEGYDCHHPFEKYLFEHGEKLLDTAKRYMINDIFIAATGQLSRWENYKRVLFPEIIRIIMIDSRYHNPIIHWALQQGQQFLDSIGAWYPYEIVPLSEEDADTRVKESHGKHVKGIMKLSAEDAAVVEQKHGKAADAIIKDVLFRGGALPNESVVQRPRHYLGLPRNLVVEQTITNADGWKLLKGKRGDQDNGPQLSDEHMDILQNEEVHRVPTKSDLAASFMMSLLSCHDDDEEHDSVGICPSLQKQSTASLLQRPCVGDDNGLAPELLALWNRSMTLSTRIKVAHHPQFTGSKELAALFPDRRRDTQFGTSKEALESWSNSREGAPRRKKKKQEPAKSGECCYSTVFYFILYILLL